MFQTKVVEQIKTHISCSATFSPENGAVYETGTAREATGDNIPYFSIDNARVIYTKKV